MTLRLPKHTIGLTNHQHISGLDDTYGIEKENGTFKFIMIVTVVVLEQELYVWRKVSAFYKELEELHITFQLYFSTVKEAQIFNGKYEVICWSELYLK